MSKNKKIIDERLREAALMFKSGLPVSLVADLTGLPEKSVEHLCWIYKWPPEKLDEMTARAKRSGQVGASARAYLKKFFTMHPEQRPAPQQKPSDQSEPVEGYVRDRNAHERLDRLWTFASDVNERLIKVEQRIGVLDDIDAGLDERIDTVSKRLDALEDEKRKHCFEQENLENAFDRRIFRLEHEPRQREERIGLLEEHIQAIETQVNHLTKKYDEIATEQFRPVIEVNHRLDAMSRQIERLQDVLKALAEALPKEYE